MEFVLIVLCLLPCWAMACAFISWSVMAWGDICEEDFRIENGWGPESSIRYAGAMNAWDEKH